MAGTAFRRAAVRLALASVLLTLLCPILHAEELIVYRPQNSADINAVRCWVRIEDMDGNDVTHTAARAAYAYMDRPRELSWYRRSFYIEGGMACHLYLNRGRYRISVFTPKSHVSDFPLPERLRADWDSDVFVYDSDIVRNSVGEGANILRVIFVSPTANGDGFYEPHWKVDYRAPVYLRDREPRFTKPGRR